MPHPWDRHVLTACAVVALGLAPVSGAVAQSTGFNFAIHANRRVSAADLGLPVPPGARLSHGRRSDAAFDLGFALGDKEYRLRGVSYVTDDAPSRVLNFYRTPLARFGEVLECERGRPVGKLTHSESGLTCDSRAEGDLDAEEVPSTADDRELRAGSPEAFHLVAVGESARRTKFVLLFVEIPRDRP